MNYVMQARSSSDGLLYTWPAEAADYAGDDYTGPGLPQEIAVLHRPQGTGGPSGPISNVSTSLEPDTRTTSDTLALTDIGKALSYDSFAGTGVFTVPADGDVSFPFGTVLFLSQGGTAQLEIVAAAGVTIQTPETLKLRKQFSCASLHKIASDTWRLSGDLELGP